MDYHAWKRGRAWIAWGLAIGSLAAMAPAAGAAPAWVAEKALTDPQTENCFEFPFGSSNYICNGSSLQPGVAFAGDGALRAVWTPNVSSSTSAMTLRRPAGGAYSSSDELAAAASGTRVGMAEDGEAVAAWSNAGNIDVAFAPPGGAFGSGSILVAAPQLLDLDVASNGAAIATFETGNAVNVSYRPPGGSFGTAEPVSATSVDFNEVSTVIDATGDALIGWARSDGTSYVPEARFRPASGPLEPTVQVLGAGVNPSQLRLAMNDDGDAAAIWFGASDYVARARYRPAGGSWGAVAPLSGGDVVGAEVAVDDAGNVLALWSRVPGGTAVTEWSFGPSGGSFSPAATFPGGLGAVPDVEFWPGGDALAVWPSPAQNPNVLNSAIRPAGGSWGTPISVLDALTARPIRGAKLATDPAGNAAVTWVEYQGDNTPTETDQAFLKGFDGAPPVLSDIVVPGSARPGQPLELSAQASDVWSSVGPVKWDFGDGDSGTGSAVQHAYAAVGDYEVEVSATDGLDQTATRTRTVHVSTDAGTGPDGTGGTGGTGGAGAPVIRRFHLTHKVFRVARRKTPVTVSARVHRGTKFVFKSSEAGRATLTIQQRKRGHWRTRRPKLKRPVEKGKNKIKFTGRYGKRKLKPGRYRAKLRVKDADGTKSAVKKARFRVVR
jgi:PKD domain-containing protein